MYVSPYGSNGNGLLMMALLQAFLQSNKRKKIRAANPKLAVTCQECYRVYQPRGGLPINYCSNCGAEIDKEA